MMPIVAPVPGEQAGPGAPGGARGATGAGADFEALLAQMLGLGVPVAPLSPPAAAGGGPDVPVGTGSGGGTPTTAGAAVLQPVPGGAAMPLELLTQGMVTDAAANLSPITATAGCEPSAEFLPAPTAGAGRPATAGMAANALGATSGMTAGPVSSVIQNSVADGTAAPGNGMTPTTATGAMANTPGAAAPGTSPGPASPGNAEPAGLSGPVVRDPGLRSETAGIDPGGAGGPVLQGNGQNTAGSASPTPSSPAPGSGDKTQLLSGPVSASTARSNRAPDSSGKAGSLSVPPSAVTDHGKAAGCAVHAKDAPAGTSRSAAAAGDSLPPASGGRAATGAGKTLSVQESLAPGVAADPGPPAGVESRGRPAGMVVIDPGSGGAVSAKPAAGSEGRASAAPTSGVSDGTAAGVTAQAPPPAGTSNPPPALNPAQVVQQVMRHLDQMRDHPGQPVRVEIAVDPPRLGPVTVKLALVRGELTAQFFTPDGAVRDAIQAVLPQLREQLAQHQLQLGQAGVFLSHGDASPGRGQGWWSQASEAAWAVHPETWSGPEPGTPGREPAPAGRLNYLV